MTIPASPPKTPLIEIKDLVRDFPAGETSIRILHGITLTLYKGEMVAIIGQSGSGKSTLMNILGCLDQASGGEYFIYGRSVNDLDSEALAKLRREHFGFIFQRYHLLGDISAQDNVTVPAVYAGMETAKRRQRALELLTALGLGDKAHHRPSQLSGGQQQRVSIARALMNGGNIILADEPTGALDSTSGIDVMTILHRLKEAGHTIIMVTHDPSLAQQADRVIELKDGQVINDHYTSNADRQRALHSSASEHPQTSGALLGVFDRLKEAFKMSINALKAHKMRTLLTMLGIIIGIASVVSIVGLGQGSQQKILADINQLGTNTITVNDGYPFGDPRRRFGYDNLTTADADAVAAQPYAKSVSPQVDSSVIARYKDIETNASVNGVGQNYLEVTGEKLMLGQGFGDHHVQNLTQDIILDHNAYQAFFNGEGNPIGEVILVGNVPGQVIGVLSKKSTSFGRQTNTPQLYMPHTTVMHRILGTSYIDRFVVLIDEDTPSAVAETAISDLVEARHGTDDFSIMNTDSIRQTVESTTSTMTLLISSIAIISLVVGGIGVMNIMLVSVTERTSEIGVRMAVGARQSDILQQFLIEAVLVCILGGLLGVGLAYAIGSAINRFGGENFQVIYSPLSIAAALACSMMIGVIFGFLPARNAARLNPVDALNRHT
ncbi:MacB family efflux pump subunit [Moraxella catarrhalis]|uniref:Pyoverdine export ATP-binding/permease protein PvdT n=1 Tax=Moraxella catarrhalis TaxID=480 RepID=A0A198UG24_MORCA|nr:MacB family efflux pump subunit [Moraxella catarrhalis]OAU95295.1 Macrolide export ATP-binding/permease protein MacB [Moraxella catarrhalis]OAU98322.1 Macrolide export ATP-binding/permease protein MacB [Moraxella catarrhalis]OAV02600.1 Macrolide export ATP-binding/permease protein MacB [Moraxella catarrhalis]